MESSEHGIRSAEKHSRNLIQPSPNRVFGFLNAKVACLFRCVKIVPFIITSGNIFLQPLIPNSIANTDAVASPEVANEDETPIRMVLQLTFNSDSLILI